MGASSYTAAHYPYDVFISHRGLDVKNTFASHLYHALSKIGLKVFLDRPELQQGDSFIAQILDAVRTASIHVAVFSPRYAESSWCLKELVLMLESGKPIIPVFYHVAPPELRWTRGKYAKALEILAKKRTDGKCRYEPDTIEKWRRALSNAAGISGFELQACNGDEGLLVEQVVKRVLKMLGLALHDDLEGDASEDVSLLHHDANGSDIELGLPQALGSNNNNQQSANELGVRQQLVSNNDSQLSGIEMVNNQPVSGLNNQPVSGLVASGGNGANIPGADGPRSNPDHSNDYVKNISSLFATCHGAILAVVALLTSAPVSSSVINIRVIILLVSALVSAAIIRDFVVKSYKEFKSQNRKLFWVIQRIALFLMFIMISVFLCLASNRLLKLHHPKV